MNKGRYFASLAKSVLGSSISPFISLKIGLFFFITLIWGSAAFAQNPEAYTYFNPEEFGDGETVTLFIEYGTASNPAESITEFQVEVWYEGFDIDESSPFELALGTQSWFGGDGAYEANYGIDHEERRISFDFSRSNNTAVSGYGYVAQLAGIVIVMDEIVGKRSPGIARIKTRVSQKLQTPSWVNHSLDVNTQTISFEPLAEVIIEGVEVIGLSGQQILKAEGDIRSLHTGTIPDQIYLLKIRTNKGIMVRKIILR